jgi:hypothetical protein
MPCGPPAQTVDWGLNMMVTGSFKLREAERGAKQQKVGIWHNYLPPASAGTKLSDVFSGTVVEVRLPGSWRSLSHACVAPVV